jgi:16S rRNA processing protein RimM
MERPASVALGTVVRAHGIRGEVRIKLHNPESQALEDGVTVTLRQGGVARAIEVVRARPVPGGAVIAKLGTVNGRGEAEALTGSVIEVARASLPPEDEGEFYVCDLVGADVVGPGGSLGSVEGVRTYPSTDVLVVRPSAAGAGSVEIPLIDDFVERVSVPERTVVVRAEALVFFQP